jgi:hypothetical protein
VFRAVQKFLPKFQYITRRHDLDAHYPSQPPRLPQYPNYPSLLCPGGEKQMQVPQILVGKSATSFPTKCGGEIIILISRHMDTCYGLGIILTGNHLQVGRGRIRITTPRMASLLL